MIHKILFMIGFALLLAGFSGCQLTDFLSCGDSGVCGYGRKYGCHGSKECQEKSKSNPTTERVVRGNEEQRNGKVTGQIFM